MRPILPFTAGLFLLAACVPAQAATNVPSRETAGAEESRFKEDRRREAAAPAAEPAVSESTPAPSGEEGGRPFRVREVRISGNYSIPDRELRPFAEPLVGKDVTLADIRAVTDAMKRHYRSKGFIAAYVYVPPQQLVGGILKIDVLEGRLGRVNVTGGKWFSSSQLERLFPLPTGEVLRYDTLRKYIDRANEQGDLKAKAVLAPGAETGTTDVNVEVEDRAPYHLSADVNNSGTDNTGEYRYGLSASHDNLFGHFEKLEGSVQLGKGIDAFGAGYSLPINDALGTRAGYAFTRASVDVGGPFAGLDVKGEATTHRAYVSQPLWEKENLRVTGEAGVDVKNVENRLLGQVSGKDDLFIPNLEIDARQTDAAGMTFFSNRFNGGVSDFLGSSRHNDPVASRQGTGGDFFYYRGTGGRFQRLPGDALLSLRGTWQASPDALAPSEQLSLGGARSVRGYQEGEYLADHGGYASLDVYVPANFIPESWRLPWSEEPVRKQVQLIAFADLGTGTLKHPLSGEEKRKDLAGAGGGFRVHLYDKFYGRFEWAVPLGDRPFDGRDKAFYFTISYDFV